MDGILEYFCCPLLRFLIFVVQWLAILNELPTINHLQYLIIGIAKCLYLNQVSFDRQPACTILRLT